MLILLFIETVIAAVISDDVVGFTRHAQNLGRIDICEVVKRGLLQKLAELESLDHVVYECVEARV